MISIPLNVALIRSIIFKIIKFGERMTAGKEAGQAAHRGGGCKEATAAAAPGVAVRVA